MTKPMSILNILLLMALVSWAANTQARDQPSGEETKVTLDQTLEWRMQNGQGHSYRILVSKPEGELPYTGGYPVIYVLDANAYFASLHEAKRAQKQYRQAIIVGIAYLGDDPHNFLRRAYDFSPPVSEEANSPPQGGQDVLLDFLEQQVMPAVAERFPVNESQQSLYGHSFGGMFAIYTLFTRPELFNHVVAASPSLWWNDRYLLKHEREFRQRVEVGGVDVTHRSLSLIVADGDSLQNQQDAAQLFERLSGLSGYGLRSSYHIVDHEDHMSVPFSIENRVLAQLVKTRNE
ncbi:alpha/beta hydrolase [Marinobacter sp. ANT_B65]|uniref:alpha/beta hydrolase n=1 Tax=Marinobacter sp. ANT_B65 TaxID=2039467 RepID=UPI0019310D42|nr:alpha/beta hydrolase-fold protein [Marinobacter sp. ANT_B65]